MRSGETGFYLAIGGAIIEHSEAHIRNILHDRKFNCTLDNVSDDLTMISVQGPKRCQQFSFSSFQRKLIFCLCRLNLCWGRGLVVRTSVFGWRTFSDTRDLWLTCDHFVGKVSDMGKPIRLTQPFIHRWGR